MTARSRSIIIVALVALAGLAIAWFLVLPRFQPHTFNGQVLQGIDAPDIELDGTTGDKVSLTDFEGKILAGYYGYTCSPDVCPISRAKLNRALDMLGDQQDEVQVVMVTVDPKRDTVDKITEYMGNFNESFIGLTGDPADIDRIATIYGVYYKAQETTSAAVYLVDHEEVSRVLSFTHTYSGQAKPGEAIEAAGVLEQHGDEQWLIVGTTREAKGEYIVSTSLLRAAGLH